MKCGNYYNIYQIRSGFVDFSSDTPTTIEVFEIIQFQSAIVPDIEKYEKYQYHGRVINEVGYDRFMTLKKVDGVYFGLFEGEGTQEQEVWKPCKVKRLSTRPEGDERVESMKSVNDVIVSRPGMYDMEDIKRIHESQGASPAGEEFGPPRGALAAESAEAAEAAEEAEEAESLLAGDPAALAAALAAEAGETVGPPPISNRARDFYGSSDDESSGESSGGGNKSSNKNKPKKRRLSKKRKSKKRRLSNKKKSKRNSL